MTYSAYEQVRYWLPMVTVISLVVKAYFTGKKNVSEFCDRLLSNHLTHIEAATVSTEKETKTTNQLLQIHSQKLDGVQATLLDHQDKNLQVWQGVLESLTILKERTRTSRSGRASTPRKRNVR